MELANAMMRTIFVVIVVVYLRLHIASHEIVIAKQKYKRKNGNERESTKLKNE